MVALVVQGWHVQTSLWTPWSPWSFDHVQNSRIEVTEEVGRSQVAQRRQEEGTFIAMVADGMCRGRPLVAPLLLWTLCIKLSDASASLVQPLCLLWSTNSIRWATTVLPFGDHGNLWAIMAMVLHPLCLLCATYCVITIVWQIQWRHKGPSGEVTQKQKLLGLSDHRGA